MLWIREVEDAKSIDDLITSVNIEDPHRSLRILILRLQEDTGRFSQETSRNKLVTTSEGKAQ